MMPSLSCQVNFGTPVNQLCVDITEYQEFVFLLGLLWKADVDQVKAHWVCSLFAIGLFDLGKKVCTIIFENCLLFWSFAKLQIFVEIKDKTIVLSDILSLAGHMIDRIQQLKEKTSKLTLLAQTPPTLLEWMRKQVMIFVLVLILT